MVSLKMRFLTLVINIYLMGQVLAADILILITQLPTADQNKRNQVS